MTCTQRLRIQLVHVRCVCKRLNVAAIFVAALLTKAKAYVRENWGAPFIMGFMLLLAVAAASLSMGLAGFADEVTVYAYYTLLVGIILQLACFLKYDRRSGEPDQRDKLNCHSRFPPTTKKTRLKLRLAC
jgi:hypothetical protein